MTNLTKSIKFQAKPKTLNFFTHDLCSDIRTRADKKFKKKTKESQKLKAILKITKAKVLPKSHTPCKQRNYEVDFYGNPFSAQQASEGEEDAYWDNEDFCDSDKHNGGLWSDLPDDTLQKNVSYLDLDKTVTDSLVYHTEQIKQKKYRSEDMENETLGDSAVFWCDFDGDFA